MEEAVQNDAVSINFQKWFASYLPFSQDISLPEAFLVNLNTLITNDIIPGQKMELFLIVICEALLNSFLTPKQSILVIKYIKNLCPSVDAILTDVIWYFDTQVSKLYCHVIYTRFFCVFDFIYILPLIVKRGPFFISCDKGQS